MTMATYIVIWAMSTTGTGIFLAIGFELGRWVVNKVKGWFSFRRGLKSNIVKDFIDEIINSQQVTIEATPARE